MSEKKIIIVGGGLAGAEAAWQAVRRGGRAVVFEMKPESYSPAHSLATLAELVCSNSLKSESIENASGILKEEMRLLDSIIIKAADQTRVPAGKTLAVDRSAFSAFVTGELERAGVEIRRGEVQALPAERPVIVATGPLTSDGLANAIEGLVGKNLNFYDAVAPIVYAESIDMRSAFSASRYGKGGDDYINCPLSKDEYDAFYAELIKADTARKHEFEDMASFEGCMPIEVMAQRGAQTLLFGPMRPVGLTDPATGKRPFAVVQLRRENLEGTLYNLVGFQTRLKFPEQKRIFRMIPALANAEFARLGKLHRNSYINSPRLLTEAQELKSSPGIFFAGQITGVEGYCESAMSGALAGINALRAALGLEAVCPPETTISGALMRYISGKDGEFSPMNANMGLLPPLTGKDRREKQARRAIDEFAKWRDVALAT
ncbi:MAG TPA: methylenetetrahydrofolate--tRNA-(uracil(54)-C(5))-methyltransferase (FADH(2)-oxidizing) TrmFO [Deltaproteobacteria bacterium]|nr:MAG: methylenetetrahydrofolate--tRNA-(uracil(54)-C(5))-methyltransferase (FADH(2)-oxidizing) TrmFO [Deltaproteobacteria bacterium GWA2_55_82]OGQ62446.1 MAG: methylenetetrahydrofolate--tRNA-(uracil(54)-C(5))-methyltransferase (FADH(2)-oxidizing) TrmFO [Deltaproteobacteria bacterium RIFCSPLOWO2_02_FULL_55_12]OIJ73331.1 MAG: methylenetetrahydrofolate--tRNA-(uracil(54)-C(5))-methyltransferase (FADH(2)-oxidizing) TrmFO [Deltaproteobacteria bacterium GWC2_55_46]HBG45395.1 methylenetetrahydrofolate-